MMALSAAVRGRNTGGLDYAYAKASALYSQSYKGSRLVDLLKHRSLEDLGRALFPDLVPPCTGRNLIPYLQRRTEDALVAELRLVLEPLSRIPPLLLFLLKGYETRWIKEALCALAHKRPLPSSRPLGDFSAGWIPEELPESALPALLSRIDQGQAREWSSILHRSSLPKPVRRFLEWETAASGGVPDRPLSAYGAGARLRCELAHRARTLFHGQPVSVAGLYGFFRCKEVEAVRLATTIEAVALDLPRERVLPLLEEDD